MSFSSGIPTGMERVCLMTNKQLGHAANISLNLSPEDRLKLAAALIASVQQELPDDKKTEALREFNHWGRNLTALIDVLDLGDWSGVEDSVEYVRKLREEQQRRRLGEQDHPPTLAELQAMPPDEREKAVKRAFDAAQDEDFEIFEANEVFDGHTDADSDDEQE